MDIQLKNVSSYRGSISDEATAIPLAPSAIRAQPSQHSLPPAKGLASALACKMSVRSADSPRS